MDPVEQHLKIAIFRWVGLKPPAYGPSSLLSEMWEGGFAVPYLFDGVHRIAKSLYKDPFFQGCPAAQNLTPAMFDAGGPIQTVGDLFGELVPCGQTQEAFDETELSESNLF